MKKLKKRKLSKKDKIFNKKLSKYHPDARKAYLAGVNNEPFELLI